MFPLILFAAVLSTSVSAKVGGKKTVAPKAVAKEKSAAAALTEDSELLFSIDAAKPLLAQGWEGGFLDEGEKGYQILQDQGRPFIRASYVPGQRLEYLYRKVQWSLKDRPILAWRWRVQKFPPNAKVLDMARSDAAAQVYVVFAVGMRKFVIKYYWGVNDGLGDEIKQSNFFAGKLWGKILRNGPPWGHWQRQMRNVYEDYKTNFGEEPPESVGAVAIMSDGDDSKGEAEADYADFRLLREAEAAAMPTAPPSPSPEPAGK